MSSPHHFETQVYMSHEIFFIKKNKKKSHCHGYILKINILITIHNYILEGGETRVSVKKNGGR